ncbi:hypothetical protein B0H13DRAFT_1977541 [Mycena leptocephala]|nr:hypothetical protein B0H13DRAFT_1977541 [Mycena leptocephala]
MATQSYQISDDLPSTVTDEDLLQAHQHKVDVRLEEIQQSLQDFQQRMTAAQREMEDIARRMAVEAGRREEWHNQWASGWDAHGQAPISSEDLDQLQRDIARLQHWRRRLDAKTGALLREGNAIAHQITLEAFVSAPVRRLPPDVLLGIFVEFTADMVKPPTIIADERVIKAPEIPGVGHGAGPLLCQVCSAWRTIACDYPFLWSSFSFPLFASASADLVDIYLDRSRSAPLTIEIDTRILTEHKSTGQRAIGLLAEHSHHLLELRILCDGTAVSGFQYLPSFQPLRGNLPLLEVLQIRVWPSLSNEFEYVPRLRTLRLRSVEELTQAHHQFDRTQIRSLTLRDASGHQLLEYPNVTDLTCFETRRRRHDIADHLMAASPALTGVKAWKIEFEKTEHDSGFAAYGISNIFHRFNIPRLLSLDVHFRGHADEMTGFLRRSQCSLTKLVLRDCNLRIKALQQILELTPDLESFTARGGHAKMITDRLFQYLTVRADTPTRLVKLSSLTLTGSFAFGTLALVRMLESRTALEAAKSTGTYVCLNDVFLSMPDRLVQVELLERLRGLDGVTVYLECLDGNKAMHRPF